MSVLSPNYETRNRIRAADVNDMINAVTKIYGVGTGDYGYGQTDITIPQVNVGDPVRDSEWQKMWNIIQTCMRHQGASWTDLPPIDYFERGKIIRAHTLNNNQGDMKGMIDSITNNRLRYKDRSLNEGWISATYAIPWKGILTHQFNIAFDNADHARNFFNTGGAFVFNMAFVADNKTDDHSMAWEHAVNKCVFTFDNNNYYDRALLTPALTTWVDNLTGYKVYEPYGYKDLRRNHMKIEVKRDATTAAALNGANGSILTFKISWIDTYTSGDTTTDFITGTMTSSIDMYVGDKILNIRLPTKQGRGNTAISITPARGDEQQGGSTLVSNNCRVRSFVATHDIINCP